MSSSLWRGRFLDRIRLGVLDACLVASGATAGETLLDSVDLAAQVEALGYTRYWLAEHHERDVAHSAPELLVPVIAGTTATIRVGTAGILLNAHPPLKVAKNFRLLETLFPGRIDLGIGAGVPPEDTLRALTGGALGSVASYPERVEALIAFLSGAANIDISPRVSPPDVWLLGSGGAFTAGMAARLGTSFGHSLLFPWSVDTVEPMHRYRSEFVPSEFLGQPQCNIAVAGICNETEAGARILREKFARWSGWSPQIVGTPDQCVEALRTLCFRYGVDEVVFMSLCEKLEDRIESYRLLADAAGLP